MADDQSALVSKASFAFGRFYRKRGRDFPWRRSKIRPFQLLLAEMLLRQTRAAQVAQVWPVLVEKYPDPKALAESDPEELYELVAILGFGRQRVAALQDASMALVEFHRGRVPKDIEKLKSLPHVGLYAAHAVACFAYGQRVPVVDVNVLRVLGRLFGETYKPDNRRAPEAWDRAWEILPLKSSARQHSYGMLDHAATICLPKKPRCLECPLNKECTWFNERVVSTTDIS